MVLAACTTSSTQLHVAVALQHVAVARVAAPTGLRCRARGGRHQKYALLCHTLTMLVAVYESKGQLSSGASAVTSTVTVRLPKPSPDAKMSCLLPKLMLRLAHPQPVSCWPLQLGAVVVSFPRDAGVALGSPRENRSLLPAHVMAPYGQPYMLRLAKIETVTGRCIRALTQGPDRDLVSSGLCHHWLHYVTGSTTDYPDWLARRESGICSS